MKTNPLAAIRPHNHSRRIPGLVRLLNVTKDKDGFWSNRGRLDGPNHWDDLIECRDLLEHIARQANRIAELEAAAEAGGV